MSMKARAAAEERPRRRLSACAVVLTPQGSKLTLVIRVKSGKQCRDRLSTKHGALPCAESGSRISTLGDVNAPS